jgi:hypothetical protein
MECVSILGSISNDPGMFFPLSWMKCNISGDGLNFSTTLFVFPWVAAACSQRLFMLSRVKSTVSDTQFYKKMFFWAILFFWLVGDNVVHANNYGEGDREGAWNSALDHVFSMSSQANPVSNNEACRRSIQDLMTRQHIPQKIADLRNLDDVALFQLAMLASVAGISRWGRDPYNTTLLKITDDGRLIHPYSPGAVESDVMLCIICALLTVIATFHLIPQNVYNATKTSQQQQMQPKNVLSLNAMTKSSFHNNNTP